MHRPLSKFWWILGLRGALGIVLGLIALGWLAAISGWLGKSLWNATFAVTDSGVLAALIVILGTYAFLDGIFAVGLGVQDFGEGRRWWVLILEGLLSIGLGIFTFAAPGLSVLFLLYWIAFWAVITGILEIVQAFHLHDFRGQRKPLIAAGVISILFGALILYPGVGGSALVALLGLYAFSFGACLVVLALRLKHVVLKFNSHLSTVF
jgi:uncharacterized membrane protein HdeD (DUF308 family)